MTRQVRNNSCEKWTRAIDQMELQVKELHKKMYSWGGFNGRADVAMTRAAENLRDAASILATQMDEPTQLLRLQALYELGSLSAGEVQVLFAMRTNMKARADRAARRIQS